MSYIDPYAGMPTAAPVMGASQYPPQFQQMQSGPRPGVFTAPTGYNYGMANPYQGVGGRMGATGMGVIGAIPAAVPMISGAAGVASMAGATSPVIGALAMADPIAMGLGAGGFAMNAGTAMGLGTVGAGALGAGATLGVGALVTGGLYAGYQGIRGFQQGYEAQAGLATTMSRYNFGSASGMGGRGLSPTQLGRIGGAMRSFDVADPFTSMADTNRMMQKFSDMNMMQGMRDAEEFSKKFTKMMDTVRNMAMVMGSTLDDAMGTFSPMRQAGFFTGQEIMGQTTLMGVMGGRGMSRDQFLGMQGQGASITRGQSMTGRSGAMAMTQAAMGFMLNPGRERQYMDITGASDFGSAVEGMAGRQVGGMTSFLNQTSAGKAMTAALGSVDESGRFTGGLDQGVMDQLMSGQVGLGDLQGIGGGKLGSKAGQASFVRHQKDITQSALEKEQTMVAITRVIQNSAKGNDDVAQMLFERMTGLDRFMYREISQMAETWEADSARKRAEIQQEVEAQILQVEIRRNRSFGGKWAGFKGGVADVYGATVGAAGQGLHTGVSRTSKSLYNQFWGINEIGVVGSSSMQAGASDFTEAMSPLIDTEKLESGSIGARVAGRGSSAAAARLYSSAKAGRVDTGALIGGSGISQGMLDRAAARAQSDYSLQTMMYEAKKAKIDGRKGDYKRLRKEINSKIERLIPAGTYNDRASALAYVAARSGGEALIADEIVDEMSGAAVDEGAQLVAAKTSFVLEAGRQTAGSATKADAWAYGLLGQTASLTELATRGWGTEIFDSEKRSAARARGRAWGEHVAYTRANYGEREELLAIEEMSRTGAGLNVLELLSGEEDLAGAVNAIRGGPGTQLENFESRYGKDTGVSAADLAAVDRIGVFANRDLDSTRRLVETGANYGKSLAKGRISQGISSQLLMGGGGAYQDYFSTELESLAGSRDRAGLTALITRARGMSSGDRNAMGPGIGQTVANIGLAAEHLASNDDIGTTDALISQLEARGWSVQGLEAGSTLTAGQREEFVMQAATNALANNVGQSQNTGLYLSGGVSPDVAALSTSVRQTAEMVNNLYLATGNMPSERTVDVAGDSGDRNVRPRT